MGGVQTAATQLSLFSETDEPDLPSGFSVRESGRARRLSIKVFPRGRVDFGLTVGPRRTIDELALPTDEPRQARRQLTARWQRDFQLAVDQWRPRASGAAAEPSPITPAPIRENE